MKLNKIFLGLIGLAAVTLASCSSDDDYTKATVTGPQVYFSSDLVNQYEISVDGNTINIPISRVDVSSAQTVALQSTVANDMYSVPASVSFNSGEKTTNIPVTYDPNRIEYGRYDDITITISDAASVSDWGISEYSFKAGVTAWVKMSGKATYREDLVTSTWSVDPQVYQVDIERNVVEEGKYRLVNPYGAIYPYNDPGDWDTSKDYYLEIDATDPNFVHIPRTQLGVDWGYGMWETLGYADYYVENGNPLDAVKQARPDLFGTLKDGVITMPAGSVLFQYGGGLRVANGSGLFAVALPGYAIADYSSSVEFKGIFTSAANEVFAVANVTLGPDAKIAKAVVIEADADADAVADAIAAGEIEAVDVVAGENYLTVAEGQTGKLKIVLVILANDKVQNVSFAEFEYFSGANPWNSIGVATYTDDFVVPMYGTRDEEGVFHAYDPYTYDVEIEEYSETPGIYRLRNLYSGVAKAFGEEGGNKDIVIHAENPNGVYFTRQATGFDLGSGEFEIESEGGSYVDYYASKYSAEELISMVPQYFGKLENGVITLPSLPILDEERNPTYDEAGNPQIYQGSIYYGENARYACRNGAFKLVLPTASSEVRAKARSKAKAFDFKCRLLGSSINYNKKVSLPHQVMKNHIIKGKVVTK